MKKIKRILKSNIVQSILALISYSYIKLVYYTNRWQIINLQHIHSLRDNSKQMIILIWHGKLLLGSCFFNDIGKCATIISGHSDGLFISKIVRLFRSGVITGSSRRGGVEALTRAISALKSGTSIIITPDGPRGPRMRISSNVVALAKKTGVPIIMIGYSCSKAKICRSWDRFMLAYPFAKSVLIASEPFYVSPETDAATIAIERQKIEDILNNVSQQADRLVLRDPILPD